MNTVKDTEDVRGDSMLCLRDVTLRYGSALAVRDASFSVEKGQVLALIGANGAGKTSLLRAISGTIPLAGGSISFEGVSTRRSPKAAIAAGIAHCPEGRQVFPLMTVRENLDLGAYIVRGRHEITRRRERMFELFPILKSREWQAAGTMSGGEQQMLAMARALMSDPALLLLDEPSMGLSPVIVDAVGDIIEGLKSQGTTIVLVEESAELALRVADRAVVMDAGSVVLDASAAEFAESDVIRNLYLGSSPTA